MKNTKGNKNSKEVILGFRVSRESIYYTSLFGVAFIISLVLLCIAVSRHNKALTIYAAILVPLFIVTASIAARFTCLSKNKIHVKDGFLVIKTFFVTRRFKIAEIKKITSAQSGSDSATSLKITYRDKTFKYTFKNFTKEQASQLKRAVKNN